MNRDQPRFTETTEHCLLDRRGGYAPSYRVSFRAATPLPRNRGSARNSPRIRGGGGGGGRPAMGISTQRVYYLITIKIYTPSFATVNCIIECIPSKGGRLFSFLLASLSSPASQARPARPDQTRPDEARPGQPPTSQPATPFCFSPRRLSSTAPSFHAAEGEALEFSGRMGRKGWREKKGKMKKRREEGGKKILAIWKEDTRQRANYSCCKLLELWTELWRGGGGRRRELPWDLDCWRKESRNELCFARLGFFFFVFCVVHRCMRVCVCVYMGGGFDLYSSSIKTGI